MKKTYDAQTFPVDRIDVEIGTLLRSFCAGVTVNVRYTDIAVYVYVYRKDSPYVDVLRIPLYGDATPDDGD